MTQRKAETREYRAALLIAQGEEFQKVADQVGVTAKTLWEWRKKPEFQALAAEVQQMLMRRQEGIVARSQARLLDALLDFATGKLELTDQQLQTNLALLGRASHAIIVPGQQGDSSTPEAGPATVEGGRLYFQVFNQAPPATLPENGSGAAFEHEEEPDA